MKQKSPQGQVRIGVIGAGLRMRTVLERMLRASGSRLTISAVHDPDAGARAALGRLLAYEPTAAPSEGSLIADSAVDWVFIGSWNHVHARQIIAAFEAGKHVFCEKPLATTFEDCVRINEAAARAPECRFALGLVLRYSPHYSIIRRVLDSGKLGRLISFEFNETLRFNHGGYIFGDWRRFTEFSGGHVLEKCCHDIDLANWLCDSLPVRVASFGGRDFFVPENAGRVGEIGPDAQNRLAYRSWATSPTHLVDPFLGQADICDNQVAILEYANGVRATFHTNCNAAIPERRLYICGSHGALRADLVTGRIETAQIGWESKIEVEQDGMTDGHGGGDDIMAAALTRTLLEEEPPLASLREGICSAVPAFGMDASCRDASIVDLRPFWERVNISLQAN